MLKKVERKNKTDPSIESIASANLSGVSIPEPVFFCSVEPASLVKKQEIHTLIN